MANVSVTRANSWSVTLGVVLVILGVVAMFAPLFATLTLIKMLGWLLILAAIEQGIYAYQARAEGALFWKIALAVLYAVVAILLLRRPVSGAMAATAILGVLFLLDGIAEIALGFDIRRAGGRSGWVFAGGIMSLIFGGFILRSFPANALWILGVLVGIRLTFKGFEQIMGSWHVEKRDLDRPSDLKRVA